MLKSRSRIEAKVWNALKGQNQIMSQICAVCESDNKIHQCIFKAHLRRSSLSICLSFVSYLPLLTSNHNNRNPLLKVVPLQMLSDSSGRREGLSVHVCVCTCLDPVTLSSINWCVWDREGLVAKKESQVIIWFVFMALSLSLALSQKSLMELMQLVRNTIVLLFLLWLAHVRVLSIGLPRLLRAWSLAHFQNPHVG